MTVPHTVPDTTDDILREYISQILVEYGFTRYSEAPHKADDGYFHPGRTWSVNGNTYGHLWLVRGRTHTGHEFYLHRTGQAHIAIGYGLYDETNYGTDAISLADPDFKLKVLSLFREIDIKAQQELQDTQKRLLDSIELLHAELSRVRKELSLLKHVGEKHG
jgi:hypothetical protein